MTPVCLSLQRLGVGLPSSIAALGAGGRLGVLLVQNLGQVDEHKERGLIWRVVVIIRVVIQLKYYYCDDHYWYVYELVVSSCVYVLLA